MNAFWEVKEAISFTNTFAFTMRCSFNVFFVCAPISSFCRERRRSEGTSLTLNTSHVKRAALWLQTVPPRQVVYRRLEGEPSLADRMAECQQVTQVCNNGLTLQSPLQLMWEGYAPKEAALTSAGEHREWKRMMTMMQVPWFLPKVALYHMCFDIQLRVMSYPLCAWLFSHSAGSGNDPCLGKAGCICKCLYLQGTAIHHS